jgi:peptide deformylase
MVSVMLTIRTLGDKVLTQKAKRVASVDDTVRTLCASMVNTMIENNGVGLAANQVGVLKRIIVVLDENNPVVMINPEILEFSQQKCEMEEGCLSIPGEYLQITRPETVKVKYRNTKGMPCINTYSGLTSRVIQHELDHLDGITMNTK